MKLIITNNTGKQIYVPWIKQLEDNYDNIKTFEKIVSFVKDKIHKGIYNRSELLNVWKKLTSGLKNVDTNNACVRNIKVLNDNKIPFLNYHHDNDAMIYLLKYSSLQLFQDVLFSFKSNEKLIGFHHYGEQKFSFTEDLNDNCPVMNCLELMFTSKTKEEFMDYRMKMEFILHLLKSYHGANFQFTIKYSLNGKIYYTTPLLESFRKKNNLMFEYIKYKGGSFNYNLNESLCKTCVTCYYNFFNIKPIHTSLLHYLHVEFPSDYSKIIDYEKNTMNTQKNKSKGTKLTKGIIQRRKNINQQRIKFNQPSLSLNGPSLNLNEPSLNLNNKTEYNTIENIKQRIALNKIKRNVLLSPLNKHTSYKIKRLWSNFNSNSNSNSNSSSNTKSSTNTSSDKVSTYSKNPYVVVGGVGGSGTRMIASILATLGLNIGSDLNDAYDNLSYTLLFKHEQILQLKSDKYSEMFNILTNSTQVNKFNLTNEDNVLLDNLSQRGRPGHPAVWLKERADNIRTISTKGALPNEYLNKIPTISQQPLKGKWGWKEPNSHTIMDRLHQQSSETKFIMVVRNGLDMAFSTNQNQLRLWGPHILPKRYLKFDKHGHIIETPQASLKCWVLTHMKVLELSKKYGKNFLMINFDDMCINKEKWLKILSDFLEIDSSLIPELLPLIKTPKDLERFKEHDISKFEKSDIEFVEKMGFNVRKIEKA